MKTSSESEKPDAAPARKCRILVVDDHPLLQGGLARLIESEPDLAIWGLAGTAADALALMAKDAPDVAVIDIFLPGATNGIELPKQLLASHPRVKVLILSMHDDPIYVERALKAGARGYVTKAEVSRVILDAIRGIWSGGTYLSPGVSAAPDARPVRAAGTPRRWGLDALTDRELELLELFGRGFSRSQIAGRLCLSVRTIESHREHMRRKLGLESAGELARYALKWIESAENRPPQNKAGPPGPSAT